MLERFRKDRKRLLELPEPAPGITRAIMIQYMSDQSAFIRKSTENIIKENGYLYSWIIPDIITSPDPDMSLRWTLIYYEIYSRSAKAIGKQMPYVSIDKIVSMSQAESSDMKLINKDEIQEVKKFVRENEDKRVKITTEEMDRNMSLKVFWSTLEERCQNSGRSESEVFLILFPLYELRSYLYEQQEANRLKQKFGKQTEM